MSKLGPMVALLMALTTGTSAALAADLQPEGKPGKGRALDVSGSLDLPGIGTINLGERRPSPPSVIPSDRTSFPDRAREVIHALAIANTVRKNDTFASYERARNTLGTIRVIAEIFEGDRYFRTIGAAANEALSATGERWSPFDEEKLYGTLETIAKTTL